MAPRNIIVKGGKIVAIVDWEMAGWYPEYWEYTTACFANALFPAFWEPFEQQGFSQRYQEEIVAEQSLNALFTRF